MNALLFALVDTIWTESLRCHRMLRSTDRLWGRPKRRHVRWVIQQIGWWRSLWGVL